VWVVVALQLVCLLCAAMAMAAEEEKQFEGTTLADLVKVKLPQPANTRVAVLPFWDYRSLQRHVDAATDVTMDLFERHGFIVTPKEISAKFVKDDKEIEPGQPLRRADALRIGLALGVNWVVYGEIYDLETYTKTSFFSTRKKGKVSIKVSVLDVPSGEIIYWHKRSDTSGGTGAFVKRAATIEYRACQVCLERAFKLLMDALPEHSLKAEPADGTQSQPAAQTEGAK